MPFSGESAARQRKAIEMSPEEKAQWFEQHGQNWTKKGGTTHAHLENPARPLPRPTRDQVRVECWEERDRLHIGIQDKESGDYYASWWDNEARQMFEDGFFKPGRDLEKSVLEYGEYIGILAK